jgi:hypothetical protein
MRKNYRYYRRDEAGRLHEAEWFHSESDEDAIAHVQSKHPDEQLEVWHDQRPVPTLATYATSSLVAGSERTLAEARRILRETASLVDPRGSYSSQDGPR